MSTPRPDQPDAQDTATTAPDRAPLALPGRRRDRKPTDLSRTHRTPRPAVTPAGDGLSVTEQALAAPSAFVEPSADPDSDQVRRGPMQTEIPASGAVSPRRATETVAAAQQDHSVPKHKRLKRREIPLSSEQCDGLDALSETLMKDPARQRVPARERERITDATLVRVAVDVLLRDHAAHLTGVSEDALRASLGLPPLDL